MVEENEQNPDFRNLKESPLPHLEVLKKLRRLKPIDPSSLGVLWFFFVTVFFFLSCFFYVGYKAVDRGGFGFSGQQSQKLIFLGFRESGQGGDGVKRVGFLEDGGGGCDLFEGNWVWDESYPLYQERDCEFLDEGFRCSQNGRLDSFYTKWRWQPKDCDLPRFDAKTMLEKLRNQRIVFIGDSIGRNQWESLLCMLSSASTKKSIYEVNGSPITKHICFLVYKCSHFNCTVEYYRAPFLVLHSRAPRGVQKKVKTTVKLDQMDWSSGYWRDADVLIFKTRSNGLEFGTLARCRCAVVEL